MVSTYDDEDEGQADGDAHRDDDSRGLNGARCA